ncbi:uncharacterized protein LOC106673689 isoform X3 [Cimex lectularius]|uniref:BZIP domain-containing protein n=1 Tax=Cimex lectularius TaxID=79782 RepID=A0A8I6SDE3_CIMLE|nr:uncharacterized protein LOC106673689 isoform X3 [Cimex lectularius]
MTKEIDLHPSAKTAHKNTSSIKKLFGLAVSTQDVAVQSENSIALYTARIFPDKDKKANMSQDKNMSSSKDLISNLTEENFCEDLIPECFKELYKRQELATKCRPRPYEKIKISKTISKRLYPSFHELVNRHCSIPRFKKYCSSMDSYKKCPLTTISQQENKLHKYLHKQKSKPNLYCRYCCVCRHNASKNMHCLRLLCKTDSNATASTSQVNKKSSKASLSMIQDKSTLRTNSKNQVAVSGEKVEDKKKDDKQNSSLQKIHSCGSEHLRKRSANQFEVSLNKIQKTKQSNEKNNSTKKKPSSTLVRKSSLPKKKSQSHNRSNSKINKSQNARNKDKLHTKSNTTLPITFIAQEPVIPCVKSISSINLLRINVKETSKLLKSRKSDSAINFQHPDMMQKGKPSSKMKDLEGGSRNQLRTQQNNETVTHKSASSQIKKQSATKISRSHSMNKLEQTKKAQSNTSVCTVRSSTDETNKKRSSKNRHSSVQIRQKKKQSQDSASSVQSQSTNNNKKQKRSYNIKRSTEKLKSEGQNKTNKTQARRSGTSVCSIRSQRSNDKVVKKYLDRDTPSKKKLTRTKIYKSSKPEISMSSTQSKSNIGTSQSDRSLQSVGSANKSSSRVSINTGLTSSTDGRKKSTTSISKSSTKRDSSRSKDRVRSKQKRKRKKFLVDAMECVCCKPVKDRNKTRRRQKKLESKGLYYLYLEKKELQSTNCMQDKSTITDNPCLAQYFSRLETVDMNQCQAESTKLPRMGFCPITYCLSKKDIKENYGCMALVPPFWVLFDNLIAIIWSLYSNSESKQGLGESRTDTQLSQQYCPIKLGFGVSAQHEKGQRDVREANSHPHSNYRRGNNEKILRIKESSHDLTVRLEVVINRNLRAPNQFKFISTVHTFKMNNVFVKIDIHFCYILITYNLFS